MIADRVRVARTLWRTFGAYGARQRARFVLRSALGRYRATPGEVPPAALEAPLPPRWPFVPSPDAVRAATDERVALARADRVRDGSYQAYRWSWRPLPASPAEWTTNPQTGFVYDPAAPWWKVPHYKPGAGDVKEPWEASRFGWAYDLARGWMLARDDRYAVAFWTRFESFLDGAPPFGGIQWACGQEAAIRAMAWMWVEGTMRDAPSSTPERLARLRQAMIGAAERIDDGHEWGASQRNNHGVSDAAGLVMAGTRFAGVHPRAAHWRRRGRALLDRYVADMFASDGWFIQHSFTYARLALEQVMMAQRALASVSESLAPTSLERARAGAGLLAELMDAATGELPLHGANDGAYILPLSLGEYRDFRPVLTMAAATLGTELPAGMEPSREVLAWLGASVDDVHVAPAYPLPHVRVGPSGWVHVRTPRVRLFARAGTYASRPAHIDPLHVDVWIDGRPVATDAGTFQYGEPWRNALAGVEVHNTLTLEGRPPARKGPRFLWLTWPRALVRDAREEGERVLVTLENQSWSDVGVRHLRRCIVDAGGVSIVDELDANDAEPVAHVQWLIDGSADALAIWGPAHAGIDQRNGDDSGPRGWISEGYGVKRAATSILVRAGATDGSLRVVTCFGDHRSDPPAETHGLEPLLAAEVGAC